MYKNMKKIDKILYDLDCLILDKNRCFEDLILFEEDKIVYNHRKRELIIDGKNIIKEDILFKLNMFYEMLYLLDSGDYESDLQMLDCFLQYYNYKFDYQDLSKEIKNIISIRKEYGVYTKEDDIIVQEIKYYFMGIHYLLEDLDNL